MYFTFQMKTNMKECLQPVSLHMTVLRLILPSFTEEKNFWLKDYEKFGSLPVS